MKTWNLIKLALHICLFVMFVTFLFCSIWTEYHGKCLLSALVCVLLAGIMADEKEED